MPTAGRFLLDTNIAIDLLEDRRGVPARIAAAGAVYVPASVLGELYFGASKSARPVENLRRIEAFAAAHNVVPTGHSIARTYGALKAEQQRKGRPIPENDLWIAATAIAHDLTLVSRDKHFLEIEGLNIVEW